MSRLMEADSLISNIFRSYPRWPSTFGECANKCGRGMGRGCGKCAYCYEDELAELVGTDLAKQLHDSVKTATKIWSTIADKLEDK